MGKTITTYLIDGNPKGSQSIFISNKICTALVIPRANLALINKRDELKSPAFYILLGEDNEAEQKAYLGETENFVERIKNHDYKKTFWQRAIVFISKDGAMTKADVQYLEFLAIKTAKETGQFNLEENKQNPKEPNLPEHQKDTMSEFFEDVRILTSFTGCSIFDLIEVKNQHIFYCNRRKIEAQGIYTENGFTVLKGSKLAIDVVNSFDWKEKRAREIVLSTEQSERFYILKQDKTFNSPSTAASFCTGANENGWTAWKDDKKNTLDSVYRNQLNETIR
ncbi:GIY-YIG nuclease family protein [Flagellimonas sp. S3867]|uniref:GIY-YIG nuclease family protein n=1 Tax=Flagellimonas sp. S3867 TaxID=2768063 RepID=UPI0016870AAB|nr:GIY-YIG nuclease family protein [Flagellimonas sp. S3867]